MADSPCMSVHEAPDNGPSFRTKAGLVIGPAAMADPNQRPKQRHGRPRVKAVTPCTKSGHRPYVSSYKICFDSCCKKIKVLTVWGDKGRNLEPNNGANLFMEPELDLWFKNAEKMTKNHRKNAKKNILKFRCWTSGN